MWDVERSTLLSLSPSDEQHARETRTESMVVSMEDRSGHLDGDDGRLSHRSLVLFGCWEMSIGHRFGSQCDLALSDTIIIR